MSESYYIPQVLFLAYPAGNTRRSYLLSYVSLTLLVSVFFCCVSGVLATGFHWHLPMERWLESQRSESLVFATLSSCRAQMTGVII